MPEKSMIRGKKSLIKRIVSKSLALLFGLMISLVLAEIILNIVGFSNPVFYVYDDLLGAGYLPGAAGIYTEEGRAFVKINSDGFRDLERAVPKPEGTYRIAVLGDSFTSAMQVDREDTFCALVEERLNQIVPQKYEKVEVLNFGRNGFGTAHELLLLKHRIWKFSPDAVVLAFFAGNDVSDNHKDLTVETALPFYQLRDNELVLDASFRENYHPNSFKVKSIEYLKTAINHSKVLQLVFKFIRPPLKPTGGNAGQYTKWLGFLHNIRSHKTVYNEPTEKAWVEAWTVTEAMLVEMQQECLKHAAEFAIVSITSPFQVYPDQEFRNSFMEDLGIEELYYPDNRIRTLTTAKQIPFLTLAPDFLKIAEKKQLFFHGLENSAFPPGTGHWNKSGHKYAAELMSVWLRNNLTAFGNRRAEPEPNEKQMY